MTKRELADIILSTNGDEFTCVFIKKSTGLERTLRGMRNVQKDLKGVGLGYNPKEHNLISIFDVDADDYRMISIDGLISVTYNGVTYLADEEVDHERNKN